MVEHSGMVKRQKVEETITFSKQDAISIQILYNDVVFVTFNIVDYDLHRVLVDNESSIDILYYSTFCQIDLSLDRLRRFDAPIVGFSRDLVPMEE